MVAVPPVPPVPEPESLAVPLMMPLPPGMAAGVVRVTTGPTSVVLAMGGLMIWAEAVVAAAATMASEAESFMGRAGEEWR